MGKKSLGLPIKNYSTDSMYIGSLGKIRESRVPTNTKKDVYHQKITREYAISKHIYSFQILPDVSVSKRRELLHPILV